jgi:hypothetical protein
MTTAAATVSRASRRSDSRFMIAPCYHFFMAGMMSLPKADCKVRGDARAQPVAVNLNPAGFAEIRCGKL